MTEIEFSDWYFLFLSPDNSTTAPVSPRSEAPLPASSSSSSVSAEVTSSLADKLHVPASQFSVSSVEQYRVGQLQRRFCLIIVNVERLIFFKWSKLSYQLLVAVVTNNRLGVATE